MKFGPRWPTRKSGETPSSSWKGTSRWPMHSAWSVVFQFVLFQLEQHELKYYGPLYGDDFTVRNNRNLREKLTYLGAYLGGKLVGDCYIFASDGYVCMDGLLVDEDFRHQYIAMTLMKHIAEKAQERGEILYLHADSEDTPKELYAKMGFQAVDKLYEYLCTDFSKLKI